MSVVERSDGHVGGVKGCGEGKCEFLPAGNFHATD